MDYGRLKELAEAFVGRGCQEYPSELEGLLGETAITGTVRMQWSIFCPVLHHRLEQEINSAFVSEGELGEEDKEMRQQLLKHLDHFENAPFTVQRLCELILQPKKHYKKLDCYLKAVEKNLLVVGTQEPDLDWMKNPRLVPQEKLTQNAIKENGTTDISKEEDPHSPPAAPPPMDKDSPPTAPTSTWSNTREDGGAEEEEEKNGEIAGSHGRVVETGRARSPPPLSRKRSRDSLEEDEDKYHITVRQEADSTVNFEPPSFDPPPPLFQVIDESPTSKKSRECVSEVDDGRGSESGEGVKGEGGEEKMEGVLSSSSEVMETAATESGAGEGEQNPKTCETTLDRSSQDEATPGNRDVKQVCPSESPEPMITN
ncbi:Serine/threonine-protein phosphatase 4 regulatory subunit 2 [Geodia barretti]|uniref:Serine/threonine-protein phosphatase 4 regulatory subunit 2 n=2 Tax=Geodia barretti TaxID=519541 RepID=A0AA35TQC2_GEOBA|nr:Serine/threonine-protein phosphatase 4 regulatory subunit 2 [Geodia barretti]